MIAAAIILTSVVIASAALIVAARHAWDEEKHRHDTHRWRGGH